MRRTRTLWRFFLAHQDARQEAWFEALARQGWHLARPGLFAFTFMAGEPCESADRLDYQVLRGEKRTEFLTLFRDAGWDFLGEKANRYYFRARPEALSPEIHSDPESRKDRIRRELRIIAFLAALGAWNTILAGVHVIPKLSWIGEPPAYMASADYLFPPVLVLTALATLGLGWCCWKLVKALRQEG